jgi:hypothetical protein
MERTMRLLPDMLRKPLMALSLCAIVLFCSTSGRAEIVTDCASGGDSGDAGNWSADTTPAGGPTLTVDTDDSGAPAAAAESPAELGDLTLIAGGGDLNTAELLLDAQDYDVTIAPSDSPSDSGGVTEFVAAGPGNISPDQVQFPEPGSFGVAVLALSALTARLRPVR